MSSTADAVCTAVEDGILTITINRPDRHNAINSDVRRRLIDAFRSTRGDTTVRAVILRGEGRSFCSGADLDSFDAEEGEEPSAGQSVLGTINGREILDEMLAVRQPIVGAVQGYALGLGATLALLCDVVIAADDCQIADNHVNVGVVAGDGGAVTWPLLLPFSRAKYYLLTGDRVRGEEAERLGLVQRVVARDDLDDTVREVAQMIAAQPPIAVAGTKETMNRILRSRLELVLDYGLLLEGATFVTDDHHEAVSALVEKRTPTYRNR